MGLIAGTSFYPCGVQVTKQKGFGKFDIAGYWQRQYQGKVRDEARAAKLYRRRTAVKLARRYLLTNLGNLKAAISAYKKRSGIEAMFKDCKSGGYNLEKSHACDDRLMSLILLIAIAYSCAILPGRKIKAMGIQKYIGRMQELGRMSRRHSSFWVGLYGQLWIPGINFFSDLVDQLMHLRRSKLPYFQQGMRAMSLIQSTF